MDHYYKQELDYLYQEGKEFAIKHPKLANSLGIDINEYTDPHLKKLVQSFAFLTGRVSRKIDQQSQKIPYQLLNILHPKIIYPTPPCSIVSFQAASSAVGKTVQAGQSLSCGDVIAVTTADVELSATQVQAAFDLGSSYNLPVKSVLVLRLINVTSPSLQLHLNFENSDSMLMYKLLFDQEIQVYSTNLKRSDVRIRPGNLNAPLYQINGYSSTQFDLVHDFLAFYKHFMFIELDNLPIGQQVELVITLSDKASPRHLQIKPDSFLANCTSVVNLFKDVTVPQKHSIEQQTHRIIPQNPNWHVHSIVSCQGLGAHTVTHPHYVDSCINYWISEQDGKHTYLTLEDTIEQTIVTHANHYNSNIEQIRSNSVFALKNSIAGLKCTNLKRFTPLVQGLKDHNYTHLLRIHNLDRLNLLGLLDIYSSIMHVEKRISQIELSEQITYKNMYNTICPVPCLMADIHTDSSAYSFVLGTIIGHTLQRMSSINQLIEFRIL